MYSDHSSCKPKAVCKRTALSPVYVAIPNRCSQFSLFESFACRVSSEAAALLPWKLAPWAWTSSLDTSALSCVAVLLPILAVPLYPFFHPARTHSDSRTSVLPSVGNVTYIQNVTHDVNMKAHKEKL